MSILAIDPGPVRSAYVVWDGERIRVHGMWDNDDMLAIVRTSGASRLAIEMVASYGMPVGREVVETVLWAGRFYQAWVESISIRPDPVLVYRLQVKQHLCNDSRAKDGNIRQALIDRLGAPGTKKAPGVTYGIKADEWAALAVAVTAWDGMKARAAEIVATLPQDGRPA